MQIDSEEDNSKAFLIVNEIILTLKDVRIVLRILLIHWFSDKSKI